MEILAKKLKRHEGKSERGGVATTSSLLRERVKLLQTLQFFIFTFELLSRFSKTEILYGIIRNNSIEITLNHIILLAKYHIYFNAISNAHLVLAAFLERLKNTVETEKYIANTSHASEGFSKK